MENLRADIRLYTSEKKKKWWENYVKHNTKFLGIPMANLRACLNEWCKSNFSKLNNTQQYDVVMNLFHCEFAEEKLIGVLLLAEHVKWSDHEILDFIEDVMEKELIYDWNITDWLCVKVLTPRLNKRDISSRLIKWSTEPYLWLRRAALVPFAQIDNLERYKDIIFGISHNLISSTERFSKTAVGWVLREMMSTCRNDILDFLKLHNTQLTTEVINNILKHEPDKKEIKSMLKKLTSEKRGFSE